MPAPATVLASAAHLTPQPGTVCEPVRLPQQLRLQRWLGRLRPCQTPRSCCAPPGLQPQSAPERAACACRHAVRQPSRRCTRRSRNGRRRGPCGRHHALACPSNGGGGALHSTGAHDMVVVVCEGWGKPAGERGPERLQAHLCWASREVGTRKPSGRSRCCAATLCRATRPTP